MAKMIGVDIGATEIRAVEIAGVGPDGFAIVTKIGIGFLPEGAVVGGRIRQPEVVAQVLIRALKDGSISRYGVVIGMANPDIAIQKMLLPASVRRDERISAVRALGRPISSTIELNESAISSALVSITPSVEGIPMATVDIVAAKQSEVDAILKICKIAKVVPRAVDLTGAALLRSLTRANAQSGEVGTVVDIGSSKVTVATRQGSNLRSVRTTLGGGADLTRAIMTVTGESFVDSERRKMSMRVGNNNRQTFSGGYVDDADEIRVVRDAVDDALSNAVDALVESIGQSIEADSVNNGSYTQVVTLCGGSTLLRGLKDKIQSRVGVPVAIGRPWVEIERTKKNARYFIEGRPDPRLLLGIAAAAGLALWREPA